jgi:alkylated DNA nucleotide flippase Atl1
MATTESHEREWKQEIEHGHENFDRGNLTTRRQRRIFASFGRHGQIRAQVRLAEHLGQRSRASTVAGTMASLPSQDEQPTPQERTLDRLGLTLEVKQSVERKWQALSQQGVQISVYTSGKDAYECRLSHASGDDILFQTPMSCTTHWEKRFFVHSSQNKKEARLEAKMYVLTEIQTLRVSSSSRGRPVADFF